jgi:hypothetical protein
MADDAAALQSENAALKAELATLKAQAASELTDIHSGVATLLKLHSRASQQMTFDRTWSASSNEWKASIDPDTGIHAHVTQQGRSAFFTLRSAAPLPSRSALAAGRQQHSQLPLYRVIVEAYSKDGWCFLGFVPKQRSDTAATVSGGAIWDYGGWSIQVWPSRDGKVEPSKYRGWTVLLPTPADGAADAAVDTSAYATTAVVPPVLPGSAVEFAVNNVTGTCRVAFYAPKAVAGGFVEVPHARMELRFIETEAHAGMPARSIPTAAGSTVELYPAVMTGGADAIWRFAAS